MNFKERKKLEKQLIDYINSDNCCIEHLMGLKIIIQAVDVAVNRKLQHIMQQKDKLQTHIKLDENNWLD